MKRSLVLIAGFVALFLATLAPTTASAGSVRVYVGPGPGYAYGDLRYRRGYVPHYSDYRPRSYYVYRVPRRYLRRRARRYWRRGF
jgi:hypothetical protein